jgi:hypothetical protein
MFARLTTTILGQDEPEAAAEIVERILPTLQSLDGFKGRLVPHQVGRFAQPRRRPLPAGVPDPRSARHSHGALPTPAQHEPRRENV